MPIEMPSGVPFSVDTWTAQSWSKKRHHFLTHAHRDHSQGILSSNKHLHSSSSSQIYATRLTKTLVLQHYPQLDGSSFVDIEVGQTLIIDDPDGNFSVTAFDANHCAGAVMFLFEGNFGNILHTGDSRLTSDCLHCLPDKYIAKKRKRPICQLDCVFLDCTFGQSSLKMPTRYSAVRQVINCIWKHPNARVVYLSCDLLGQEDILINVSKTFGSKIFVDKDKNPEYFRALEVTAPEILSEDPSCRFHVLEGFPRLWERAKAMLAEAKSYSQPEPLIIRPSTQWYVHDDSLLYVDGQGRERSGEAVRDPFGVWHICYSMHSSTEELEWALQLLAPKWVVSTTPSCRAMELSYVKKNCFGKQLSSDDPLWKLLGIRLEASPSSDMSDGVVSGSFRVGDIYESEVVESGMELKIESFTNEKSILIRSPPKKKHPVTLFGRARLGVPDFVFKDEEKKTTVKEDDLLGTSRDNITEFESIFQDSEEIKTDTTEEYSEWLVQKEINIEENCEKLVNDDDFTEVRVHSKTIVEEEVKSHFSSYSHKGLSKGFSDRFRKMYRSLNVAVPEPLPSLVELMKANKRSRMRS